MTRAPPEWRRTSGRTGWDSFGVPTSTLFIRRILTFLRRCNRCCLLYHRAGRPVVKGGNFRSAVEYVAAHAAPGDATYINWAAAPAYRYYWDGRQFGAAHDSGLVAWGNRYADSAQYIVDVQRCFGLSPRCWLVFSNLGGTQIEDARQIILMSASIAVERDSFVPKGILKDVPPADPSVYLYEVQQ